MSSGNPRLLAVWLGEFFDRFAPHFTPATQCDISAWPDELGYRFDPDIGRVVSTDWIMDSRWLGEGYPCRTPAEAAAALVRAVADMEAQRS